jgi:hypothetical protein
MTKKSYFACAIAVALALPMNTAWAGAQRPPVMKPGGGGDPTSLINQASQNSVYSQGGNSSRSSGSGSSSSSSSSSSTGVAAPMIPNKVYTSPRVGKLSPAPQIAIESASARKWIAEEFGDRVARHREGSIAFGEQFRRRFGAGMCSAEQSAELLPLSGPEIDQHG